MLGLQLHIALNSTCEKAASCSTIKMASNFPSTSDPGPSEVFSNSSGDESDFTPPDPVGPPTVSVLDKLSVPRKSDLARVRKVQKNPPIGKKRSSAVVLLKPS